MTINLIKSLAAILCMSISGLSMPSIGRSFCPAQSAAGCPTVIGEVTSIDMNSRAAVIKTDAGELITLSFSSDTKFLKVRPGDTALSSASETTLGLIGVGDRLSSRGLPGPHNSGLLAALVIVMSKADIRQKQQQQEREWSTRSIAGVVRELNPGSTEITVETYGPAGTRIVVQTTGCRFRRYSPVSVRFSDSRPGAFSDLKVGDQLRALGNKSANGSAWVASEIVSGSFQTIGGTVTSVDQQKSEIKISTLGQKRELVVEITTDSTIKRMSQQAAMIIAQRALGVRPGPPSPAAMPKSPAAPKTSAPPPQNNPALAQAPQLPDSQQIIDSLPPIALSAIKPGDVIAVTSTAGNSARVSAIKLVAGVDVVINAMNAQAGRRQMIALSAGLPAGIFDYGISQP